MQISWRDSNPTPRWIVRQIGRMCFLYASVKIFRWAAQKIVPEENKEGSNIREEGTNFMIYPSSAFFFFFCSKTGEGCPLQEWIRLRRLTKKQKKILKWTLRRQGEVIYVIRCAACHLLLPATGERSLLALVQRGDNFGTVFFCLLLGRYFTGRGRAQVTGVALVDFRICVSLFAFQWLQWAPCGSMDSWG